MPKNPSQNKNHVFDVIKYMFPIAWRIHKGYFFCGAIELIADALKPFVSMLMLPVIINEIVSGFSSGGSPDITKLLICAAVIVLGERLLDLISSVMYIQREKYSEKFENYFTEQMSKRVMELDFQLTEDKEALEQIEKAKTGMSWYSGGVNGIANQLFGIISNSLSIAGSALLILLNAPLLFAVTAVILVVNVIVNKKAAAIEIDQFNKLSKLNRVFGYLGWQVVDFRYGKDIRLYGARDMMIEKWKWYNNKSLMHWKEGADKQIPLDIIRDIAGAARDLATYLYLGILVIFGEISIGIFSQMLSAGSTLTNSLGNIAGNVQEIIKRTNYAYEYVKFMHYPAAIEKGTRHVEDKPHTFEFRNVSFTYPKTDVKVLDGVNLTLSQGQHLSVVGLNGAGKTTFVKLLCRLYDPTEGEILLDGVNIKEYDYAEYMELFSPVFQDFKLFAFSIADNVTFGSENNGDVTPLLDKVGLSDKIKSLEKGADTMLFKAFDENGIEPSGGEQQKIAIARALYKSSPVVILDEPTAALDPVAEYDIYRQFNTLVGGKTAIYISHRLSSCKFCDMIAVFSEGRIKEYGTHDELVDMDNGVYAEMFAAQAHYYN